MDPPCAGAIANTSAAIPSSENMISETEMLNRISSYHQTTKKAQCAHFHAQGSAVRRVPMRKLIVALTGLVNKV